MCQIQFEFAARGGEMKVKWTKWALSLSLLTGMTSIITLGGLAAVQDQCHPDLPAYTAALAPIFGFSPLQLSCNALFRYYWFIVIFNIFLVLAGAAVTLCASHYTKWRYAVCGLFVVATLLFMQSSDSWLTMSEAEYFQQDTQKDRVRTAVAGFISTAALNGLMVVVFGYQPNA